MPWPKATRHENMGPRWCLGSHSKHSNRYQTSLPSCFCCSLWLTLKLSFNMFWCLTFWNGCGWFLSCPYLDGFCNKDLIVVFLVTLDEEKVVTQKLKAMEWYSWSPTGYELPRPRLNHTLKEPVWSRALIFIVTICFRFNFIDVRFFCEHSL